MSSLAHMHHFVKGHGYILDLLDFLFFLALTRPLLVLNAP